MLAHLPLSLHTCYMCKDIRADLYAYVCGCIFSGGRARLSPVGTRLQSCSLPLLLGFRGEARLGACGASAWLGSCRVS